MKSIMNKVCLLAGILLACVPAAHATTGVSVSSFTQMGSANSPIVPAVLYVRAGEGAQAILTSTAPLNQGTTVNFEVSTNFSNWLVLFSTATGSGGFGPGISTLLAPVSQDSFYRWNIISTQTAGSNAGGVPFTLTIRDLDDTNPRLVIKNYKQQDSVYYNDDSVQMFGALRPDRTQYQQANSFDQVASSDGIIMSSYTQIGWGLTVPANKTYGQSVVFSTNTVYVDRSFVVIRATGVAAQAGDGTNGITLSAKPTISTDTANNGDTVAFMARTSSITFTDNGASAGTALRLGATTRAVGLGDILELMFWNGFWYENRFINNQE